MSDDKMTPFTFEERPIRVQMDERGNPWFNAGDVCGVLGYVNPRDALATHVDEEDVAKRDTHTPGGPQLTNHLNESGVYALIFGSTKPEARRFKRWVTSEVLPEIRKTGSYEKGGAPGVTSLAKLASQMDTAIRLGAFLKRVPGANPVMVARAVLDMVEQATGMDVEKFRQALPESSAWSGEKEVVFPPAAGPGKVMTVEAVLEEIRRVAEAGGGAFTVGEILVSLGVEHNRSAATLVGRILREFGFFRGGLKRRGAEVVTIWRAMPGMAAASKAGKRG